MIRYEINNKGDKMIKGFEVLGSTDESEKFSVLFSEDQGFNYGLINSDGSDRIKIIEDEEENKSILIDDKDEKIKNFFEENKYNSYTQENGFIKVPLKSFEIKKDFSFVLKTEGGINIDLNATKIKLTKGTKENKKVFEHDYDAKADVLLSNNYFNDIASKKVVSKEIPVQAVEVVANNAELFKKNNIEALSLDLAADGENKKLRLLSFDNPNLPKATDKRITYVYVLDKKNKPIIAQLSSKFKFCLKSEATKTVTEIRNEIQNGNEKEIENLLENFGQVKFNIISDLIPNKKSKQKEKDSAGNDTACLISKLDGEVLSKLFHYAKRNQNFGSFNKYVDLSSSTVGNYQSIPVQIKEVKQDFDFSKKEIMEQELVQTLNDEEAPTEVIGEVEPPVATENNENFAVSEQANVESAPVEETNESQETQNIIEEGNQPKNVAQDEKPGKTEEDQNQSPKVEEEKPVSDKAYVYPAKGKYLVMGILLGAFALIALLTGLAGLLSMCVAFGSLAVGMGTVMAAEVTADAGAGRMEVSLAGEGKPSRTKSKDREARKEKRKEKRNERKAKRNKKQKKSKEKDDDNTPPDIPPGAESSVISSINNETTEHKDDEQTEEILDETLANENQPEDTTELGEQEQRETTEASNEVIDENIEEPQVEDATSAEQSDSEEVEQETTETVVNALTEAVASTAQSQEIQKDEALTRYVSRLNKEIEEQRDESISNGEWNPPNNSPKTRDDGRDGQ